MHDWKKGLEGMTRIRPACDRNCQNRAYDCHIKCETYIKYREACDAERAKRMLERDVACAYADTAERIRKKRRLK